MAPRVCIFKASILPYPKRRNHMKSHCIIYGDGWFDYMGGVSGRNRGTNSIKLIILSTSYQDIPRTLSFE